MNLKIPKELLSTKDRKELWMEGKGILRKVDKALGISEAYVIGSFASKKRRPADIDFAIAVKVKKRGKNNAWPIDFVIIPDGASMKSYVDDLKEWMGQKFGKRRIRVVKLK